MADPLAISTGQGKGAAQVFQPSINTGTALQYGMRDRAAKEREAAKQEAARKKSVDDIFSNLEEVNVTGYLPHVNYLTKQKESVRDYMSNKYVDSDGKYSPATDPVVGKLVSTLKKENAMSTQIKDYAKQLPTMLTKENSKNYTTESIGEIDRFLKMPLNQQVKYVEDNGAYPLPKPKPEVIDYDKSIDDLGKGLSEKSSTVEKALSTGGTETISVSGFDPENVDLYAKSYVIAGVEGRRPDAAALLVSTRKKLEEDIVFQAMDEEAQDLKVIKEAEDYTRKRIKAQEKKDFKKNLEGKGGFELNFGGGGNTAENDQVRVVVKDTPEKRTYNIAQIKGTENSVLDFSLPDGSVVKGTPLRIEKYPSGGKDVIVSVDEMTTQTTGRGSKQVTKEVKTGKKIEKKVPYKTNEDRIFKGKFKFTLDDIDAGLTEKGVQVKESEEDKFEIQGKSYGKSAIEKAAKASGMSVDEYVKEANL